MLRSTSRREPGRYFTLERFPIRALGSRWREPVGVDPFAAEPVRNRNPGHDDAEAGDRAPGDVAVPGDVPVDAAGLLEPKHAAISREGTWELQGRCCAARFLHEAADEGVAAGVE